MTAGNSSMDRIADVFISSEKKQEKKENPWISGKHCFSCGSYLYDRPDYESLTGCPVCNRSFVE